jgi:metallo-beta-lactamase class B
MKIRSGAAMLALLAAFGVSTSLAQPAADTPDSLVVDAKRAAGTDFPGTFARLCVAPDNMNTGRGGAGRGGAAPAAARGAAAAPAPRPAPDRATWYAPPYKVFDNLYWVGTKIHSSWAINTSAGIILIDTLYDYAVEPEIVEGLRKIGLNPANIKYVIISHAHGDHDQGAALLQSRFGAHVIMGAPDWESTLQRPPSSAGGVPKRDIVVTDTQKLTLGDTTITIVPTPGHTPGTLSVIFPVKDRGRALTVAYSGGTAFNFPRAAENFQIYENSQKRMAQAAAEAGASILMTNHTEFDGAYDKVRIAQLPRAAGEPHPYEIGAAAVARYFTVTADCAESQRLLMTMTK